MFWNISSGSLLSRRSSSLSSLSEMLKDKIVFVKSIINNTLFAEVIKKNIYTT